MATRDDDAFVLPLAEVRHGLRADCGRCFALCCAALPFTASSDFAFDKPAGVACGHLGEDFGCTIHASLRERGFAGCVVFDCFGAGQHVAQHTYGGTDWRQAPETARDMFEVFPVVRVLHELLWYLTEAEALPSARSMRAQLAAAVTETERLARLSPPELLALDVEAHRANGNALLVKASELARAAVPGRADHRGADLIGKNLAGADLSGASLRGAQLVGADLRGAKLRLADLTGADTRGADLSGAQLEHGLFLTRPQLTAARGDAATTLPPWLERPSHWA
ncbi:hypothetical protein BAY61_15520 [Prauserella marina]|uniref:Pentapeptide repeat-containing protein n=1 Tax=Prauserella marina TaxID=530584 RepID=A0A222VR23_9PSEU|nr:pentapeptide repeat-containing protein [Prauserella marina]ASR36181.1 hypothetical protein BAY61_15520 [Prauserella marina]PWV76932.1 pentapeptide repeat protein [Prauserella marina]SDD00635.1 Pentapeptide repeat-containing protein [Prauserella marina]